MCIKLIFISKNSTKKLVSQYCKNRLLSSYWIFVPLPLWLLFNFGDFIEFVYILYWFYMRYISLLVWYFHLFDLPTPSPDHSDTCNSFHIITEDKFIFYKHDQITLFTIFYLRWFINLATFYKKKTQHLWRIIMQNYND